MLIPIAIPITPQLNTRPNNAEKKSLAPIVSVIDTIIVNFTSPAARSPLPSEPANGYASPLKILFINTSHITSVFVFADIAEYCIISGVIAKTNAFHNIDNANVIRFNFLK